MLSGDGVVGRDGGLHRIALINVGDGAHEVGTGAGVDHIAFTYATLDDLLNTFVRLRDNDVTMAMPDADQRGRTPLLTGHSL